MGKGKKTISKKNKKARTKLDIQVNLIVNIILISILFFGSISMFVMACNINVENTDVLLTYKEESDIDYKITLNDNPHYSTSTLGMEQQYKLPATLIKTIDINFKYNFTTSEKSNYKYRYFATATTVINSKTDTSEQGTNLLLEEAKQLEDEVNGEEASINSFSLDKTYSIDYGTYNDFVTSYRNAYNLSLDAYLKVVLYVEVTDIYHDSSIVSSKTMEVRIPLATNPVGLTLNNPDDIEGKLESGSDLIENNYIFIIIAVIMLILSILLFVQEFKKVLKSDSEQSKYINKLHKIISANSDVIVKVTNKINLKNSNIIEVETMNELLDAQNELRIPIAYFETKRNEEGCFVIVNGKEVWRYILRVEDEK